MARLKTSVGIWAFGPAVTRFMPAGYHPELARKSMVDRVKWVVDGLGDWMDSYEFHYPGEIDEKSLPKIQKALGKRDIYCIAGGLHCMPDMAQGGLTNPDAKRRRKAIDIVKRALDIAASVKARYIIWPGGEGYNYPFQVAYDVVWKQFLEGLQEVVEHANEKGVPIYLEHKNSEPAMRIHMRDIGMSIFIIKKLKDMGTDVSNMSVNMDWQHLIMNGEPLAEYAALLAMEGLLGHQHANDGWGSFDDDNMVGTGFFFQALGLALELRRANYGARGERLGFDLYPYTEDPIASVKRSVIHWEFLWDLSARIDAKRLRECQLRKDAIGCYEAVYEVMGLDKKFIERTLKAKRK